MLSYIFGSAKSSFSFVTSTLLLCLLFSAIPTSINGLQASKLSTTESISKYGRGSYDILVRPESSRTGIEKSKGLVEENFLTGGQGGISLDQFQGIKDTTGVEVAAPVAVLGFFTNDTGGFSLPLPTAKNSQVEITSVKISNRTGLSSEYNTKYDTHIMTFPYDDFPFFPNRALAFRQIDNHFETNFVLPENYNLIVAIDPQQENALIGSEIDIKSKLPETLGLTKANNPNTPSDNQQIPSIPLLTNDDVESTLQAVYEERTVKESPVLLRKQAESVKDLAKQADAVFAPLVTEKPVIQKQIDLSQYIKPFKVTQLNLQEDGTIQVSSDGINSTLRTSTYYLTNRLQYAVSTDGKTDLTLVPAIVQGKTMYRELTQSGFTEQQAQGYNKLYNFNIIGSYKGNVVGNNDLDPSPLGIYTFSPIKQIVDNEGRHVNVELKKDMVPDTFLPIQASALTNLQAAEFLKGKTPIDAIRVRVAGITRYDAEAEAKILRVAQAIHLTTGLHVDIVAGASKQEMKVSIPAVDGHPAVGTVQETWTTLGVSTAIVQATNQTNLWILAGMILIVILHVVVHTQSLFTLRHKELTILQAIGWNAKDISKMFILEWGLKALISFLISLVSLLILKRYISLDHYWAICIGTQSIMLVFLLVTVFVSIKRITTRELQLGRAIEWKENTSNLKSIFSICWGNFKGQIRYNIGNILLFSISGAVGLWTLNMILAGRKSIGVTFLGAAVNAASNTTQWLIIFATLFMFIYGVFEANLTLVSKRAQEIEILRMIGWNKESSIMLILGELSIVLGSGGGAAMIIGFLLFRSLYSGFTVPLYNQIGYVALGILLLLWTAYFILRKYAFRLR